MTKKVYCVLSFKASQKRAPEKDLRRKDFLGKGATDRKVLPITFSNRLTKNRVATRSHLNL